MRIAIGQLWQETNTLNPLPTTRADFESFGIVRGDALVAHMAETNELGGFIQSLRQWPERPEISVWMSREDARTVSVTSVELGAGGAARMVYRDDGGEREASLSQGLGARAGAAR